MTATELLDHLERLLNESKTGVLATTDPDGRPRLRWMSPALIRTRPGSLYAITAPDSRKTFDLKKHPDVEWMIQSVDLREVIRLRGIASLIDNPAIKGEILETLGPRLTAFWKANPGYGGFLALETQLLDADYYKPMEGRKFPVVFRTAPAPRGTSQIEVTP